MVYLYICIAYELGNEIECEALTRHLFKCNADPERFRFARDTSFGRRHLNFWSKSTITLWIACFFRQFFGSVTKVDYLTLRHGFIMVNPVFDFSTFFHCLKTASLSLEKVLTAKMLLL